MGLNMKKVVLTTGGTGGHIYPALAIAKELKNREVETLFIGSKYRMENELVPENGFDFIGLDIKPIKITNIKSIYRLFKSIIKSIIILYKEKVDCVIGFGNYISIPVLIAAFLLGKKIYLQEQNINLGLANRVFYRVAKKLFVAFDKTYEGIPRKYQHKVVVTGNPLRKEFEHIDREEERERLKIGNNEKILLIIGGSLGAKKINDAVLNNWDELFKNLDIRVYWATGKNHFDEINNKIRKRKPNDVIKPYFDSIAKIMSASDLLICRAGALTVSEVIELQKPSIMIPYKSSDVGQKQNAKLLEKIGAAKVYDEDNSDEAIKEAIKLIKDEKALKKMSNNLSLIKKSNSTLKIVNEIDIWRN
jgi:UDP-N-acetylglucosamine--N-acetylmuramyl-(pentapeptide) pyrophosphoryl-undecaprenol N-acetylglucosamine transferase